MQRVGVRPRANENTAIGMKVNDAYGILCRDDGIETTANEVYGIHTEGSPSPSYAAYEDIETTPTARNRCIEITPS